MAIEELELQNTVRVQTMVDLLPSMRTGEALISGEAVKIPTRIKFYRSAYLHRNYKNVYPYEKVG